MKYLIGIDVGTSSTKTVLFDDKLNVIKEASKEYELYQPKNGWAEQNPSDWSNAVICTLKEIIKDIEKEHVLAIGLTGQMHGLVMLDEKNEVIRPAIIWADQRTSKECEEITQKIGYDNLINITANPALTGFTLSKLLWVKNNEPDNYSRCKKILLPKDYIRFILTNEFKTDVTDASGMQMLNVSKRSWSKEILEKLEIDFSILPEVLESQEISGKLSENIKKELKINNDIYVVAGAGDNAAAAVGVGVIEEKQAFTTIGTSGVVFAPTSKPIIDKQGRIHTFCAAIPNTWHVMGVTQAAGLSMSWFRNNFYSENERFSEITKNIKDVEIGSNKLIYLPYLMGERTPHLDPNARGVFFGISASHTKIHFLRSIMEGITFSLKDCLEIINEQGINISEMKVTGGGSKNKDWLQMITDIYEIPSYTVNSTGTTLGAAILAGVGVKIFDDVKQACDMIKKNDKYMPIMENGLKYSKYYKIYKELYNSLKNNFKTLSNI